MKQKRKHGFTLIELLAVIVILAIIALIAVPVILNIIDKANKSAFKDTAYGVISAGELFYAENQLEPQGMLSDVTITLPDERIPLKGSIPEGKVMITRDGKVSIAVKNDRYCITKGLDDTDVTVIENSETCELPVGNSSEENETLGFPIAWNTLDVMGNASFNLDGTPYVKVSDFAPSLDELTNSSMSLSAEGEETLVFYYSDGYDGGKICTAWFDWRSGNDSASTLCLSVLEAGEYEELGTFLETGLYVMDFGLLGNNGDIVIDLVDSSEG